MRSNLFNNVGTTKHRAVMLLAVLLVITASSRLLQADTATCGGNSITLPFTDVPSSNIFFCSIAEAYFDGLTNGTSATTYNPYDPVAREQMAAFITRTQDSALRRGNRRAAMQQWWIPTTSGALHNVDLGAGNNPFDMVCDGADIWTSNNNGTISRVRASDGKLLGTWTGATGATGIIVAAGRIYITAANGANPGKIYVIDPASTPGPVTVFENDIGVGPIQITFDGTNLWTCNNGNTPARSISRVDIGTGVDSTFNFGSDFPDDILWDGANLWMADGSFSFIKRIDPANGSVIESIEVQQAPNRLLFDGTNLWVSSRSLDNITVVRATGALRGAVLASLTSTGGPVAMAFDGERVLVCNYDGNSASLFKAADFAPLGTVSTGANGGPFSVCSDSLNFWIGRINKHDIVRF